MRPRAAKRVLVVIDEMEVGGSQRQIAHLLTGIDRANWEPELLYFREPSFLVDALLHAGIPVRRLPKRGRIDPGFLIRLVRLLRRERYDLIHAFSLTAELWTLIASRMLRRPPPVVASVRSLNLDAPAWYWRLKRFVFRHSAATIANAQAAAMAAAVRGRWPLDQFDVIGNGVPLPSAISPTERQTLREAIGVPDGRVFGLFVGRLIAVKNLPGLLDALASLPLGQRPWIALAGDGPLRESLERQRSDAALTQDLFLLGQRADATRLMQAADFLVLCSDQEGLSNALLEAMAAACPVIASSVGGNPELIEHERTGLLFLANDRAALAGALARITNDADLRARLSMQAREEAATRHGIPALVAATLGVYERCLVMQP